MSKSKIEEYYKFDPTDANLWRTINLFGVNTASYKFALAKSLLKLGIENKTEIKLIELAEPFAKFTCEHLKINSRQTTSPSSKFLEACKNFNQDKISYDELISMTEKHGFNYVLERFHIINGETTEKKFFINERKSSKKIILTDTIIKLSTSETGKNLFEETESRWTLVETGWSLEVPSHIVQTDSDGSIFFIPNKKGSRKNLTSSRPPLNGYQKGKCFYCFDKISIVSKSDNVCHIEHFIPNFLENKAQELKLASKSNSDYLEGLQKLTNLNGIWNLVLSCQDCNKMSGKGKKIPTERLLKRLFKRNEYFITSHEVLKGTIMAQTGYTPIDRENFLKERHKFAVDDMKIPEWEPTPKGAETF